MDAIPDLAKKTSINSLLNPEAASTSGGVSYGPMAVAPHLVGAGGAGDVYGGAGYGAGTSFGLRAASWTGQDERRKDGRGVYEGGVDVYGRAGRDTGGGWGEYGAGGTATIAPMYSDERTGPSFFQISVY